MHAIWDRAAEVARLQLNLIGLPRGTKIPGSTLSKKRMENII